MHGGNLKVGKGRKFLVREQKKNLAGSKSPETQFNGNAYVKEVSARVAKWIKF